MDEKQRKEVQASLTKIGQEIAVIRGVLKAIPAKKTIGDFEPPPPPIIFGSACTPIPKKDDDLPPRTIRVKELNDAVAYLDRLNSSIKEVLGQTPAPKPPGK